MTPFSASILSTVAFYDAVGKTALTKLELYKRFMKSFGGASQAPLSFGAFSSSLEKNWDELSIHVSHCRGFYSFRSNNAAYTRRIHTAKTAIKKWRRAQKMAKVIALFPSVQMVGITGSLALNNTHPGSDIDVLIVSQANSIWTTRILVSAAMHVLGARRRGNKIADRICLNHYIAEDGLPLRPQNLFSAHICATLVPLINKNRVYQRFIAANERLIGRFFQNFLAAERLLHSKTLEIKQRQKRRLSRSIAEKLLKRLQTQKIKLRKDAERPILDDQALVFHHPRPQSQEALYLYAKNLKELRLECIPKLSPLYTLDTNNRTRDNIK